MKSGLNKEKILQDVTNNTIKNLDNHFQEHYNTSFSKQVNKQNDLNFKHEKTSTVRKAVKDIENQWKETSLSIGSWPAKRWRLFLLVMWYQCHLGTKHVPCI